MNERPSERTDIDTSELLVRNRLVNDKRAATEKIRSSLADLRDETDGMEMAEELSHEAIGGMLYNEIRDAHEHGNAFMPQPDARDNPQAGNKAIRVYANQLPRGLVESEEAVIRTFATKVRKSIQGREVRQRDNKIYVIDVRAITFEYMDRSKATVSINVQYLLRHKDNRLTRPRQGEDR